MLSDLRHRWRALFRRETVEQELEDELRFHLEQETGKLVGQGVPPDEAARRSRIALGGVEQVKEDHRQARGVYLVETTFQDLRYALRSLRRTPGFTTAALLTLALTTGAVSAVVSLANSMLWRPLPVPRPDRLALVAAVRHRPTFAQDRISYADYVHVRERVTTIEGLAAHLGGFTPFWATYNGRTGELNGAIVSANLFQVLRLAPAAGRFFSPEEDLVPGRDRVAVISHRLWREAWGGAPEALGSTVTLYGTPFTIVGVAPRGFHGVVAQHADVYIPTMMMRVLGAGGDPIANPDLATVNMIGRLRDGRSLDEARAELATLAPPRWRTESTAKRAQWELTASGVRGAWGAAWIRGLPDWKEGRALIALAAVCLLLGCANLAGLLAARGSRRATELAIRPSLGATPLRLVRQLMTESLLLALGGGALGLVLALFLARFYLAAFFERTNGQLMHYDTRPDALVVAATLAVCIAAAFLFGLLPALTSIRQGAALALSRQPCPTPSHTRLTRALIGAQIASALALVALAGLLASSQRRFVSDSHFEPSPVALMRLAPSFGATSRQRYPPAKAEALHRTALQRLSQLPGVAAACLFTANGPLLDGRPVTVSRPEVADAPAVEAGWHATSPGFFSVLGIPLRQGRDFDPRDVRDAPRVAIVSERLAQLLWPGGDALGSTLTVNEDAPARVVGIVADVTARAAGQPATPHVYRPFGQEGGLDARYAVRVQGDPAAALPALVLAVTDVDSEVSVRDTSSMAEALAGEELRNVRMTAAIATYGALLAVLLSAIGIYGTVAFSVARRTREIGVRIAVGAGPRDVVALILREEMRTVLAGMLAGLALAWGGSRLIRHLLYGSAPHDLVPYAVAAGVVAVAAMLACWLPSRRAARLDPMTALRVD